MQHRAAPPPLSAKAQLLLAQLKSNVTQPQKSQYVESLVENAAKRKLAAELALERKLAREDADKGLDELTVFVTKEYSDQVAASSRVLGQDEENSRFIKGEFVDVAARQQQPPSKRQRRRSEDYPPEATKNAQEQADALKRSRLERRMARKAPPSKITQEMIQDCRARALARVLLS